MNLPRCGASRSGAWRRTPAPCSSMPSDNRRFGGPPLSLKSLPSCPRLFRRQGRARAPFRDGTRRRHCDADTGPPNRAVLATLALALSTASVSAQQGPEPAARATPPSAEASPNDIDGATMFATVCGFCHQDGGRTEGRDRSLPERRAATISSSRESATASPVPCRRLAACSPKARSSQSWPTFAPLVITEWQQERCFDMGRHTRALIRVSIRFQEFVFSRPIG